MTNKHDRLMKITISENIIFIIVVGISILFIPFFVLADEGHDETVPHTNILEVRVSSLEPEVFEMNTEEEIEHEEGDEHDDSAHVEDVNVESAAQTSKIEEKEGFVGDGHTEHTHSEVSFVVWWQSKMWWVMFLVSLFLMTILSFGVYKFLEVKK